MTLLGGVSDLTGLCCAVSAIKCTQLCHCSVGSDTPQDLFLAVWYPTRSCSVGSDTPQDFVLRGIRPRWKRGIRPRWKIMIPKNQAKKLWEHASPFKLTKICSAGYQTSQNTFWSWICVWIRNRIWKYLGCVTGMIWGRFMKIESRATVALMYEPFS
jgi:hypothetical protein